MIVLVKVGVKFIRGIKISRVVRKYVKFFLRFLLFENLCFLRFFLIIVVRVFFRVVIVMVFIVIFIGKKYIIMNEVVVKYMWVVIFLCL